MLKSVEGIFRNGKIDLLESPPTSEESRVLITFLPAAPSINLRDRAIDEDHAADLRARLAAFAEDWNRPDMDVYDEM